MVLEASNVGRSGAIEILGRVIKDVGDLQRVSKDIEEQGMRRAI